jgi:hypothetical protein
MKGYVQNTTPIYAHAMKRVIGPGVKVPLEELYEQYGRKHNLSKGQEFVEWLRNVKLRDVDKWKIVTEDEENVELEVRVTKRLDEVSAETTIEGGEASVPAEKRNKDLEPVGTVNVKEMTVEDVVGLSVRKAREVIPEIRDVNLLKYALQEAAPRAGKDSLCIILRKRIQELGVTTY